MGGGWERKVFSGYGRVVEELFLLRDGRLGVRICEFRDGKKCFYVYRFYVTDLLRLKGKCIRRIDEKKFPQ